MVTACLPWCDVSIKSRHLGKSVFGSFGPQPQLKTQDHILSLEFIGLNYAMAGKQIDF